MTTISSTFSAAGVSSVLRLKNQPEQVTYAVTGPYHGSVAFERAVNPSEGAWETVALAPAAGLSAVYTSRAGDALRFRALTVPTAFVTNGTMASDTGWTKGDGWTIAAGVADCDGSQADVSDLEQSLAIDLVEGASYSVSVVVTRSAGTITPVLGGTAGTARSSSATFTETIVAGATSVLAMSADADFIGTVDTITVTPVISYSIADGDAILEEKRDLENVVQQTRTQSGVVRTGNETVTGNHTVTGDQAVTGASTAASYTATGALTGGSLVVGTADLSEADLEVIDGVTPGTGAASKMLALDAGEDLTLPNAGVLTLGVLATAAEAAEHGAGAIGTAAVPVTYRWIEHGVIVTQIKFDLTGLASVATADDVIGLAAGGVAFIGRNVVATNGVVFKVELSCLETPAGGDNDVNVVANASGTLIYDDAGGATYLSNSGDLLAGQTIQNLVPALAANVYFYLTAGTGDTAGTYTAGMYVLTLYGHPVLA